MEDLEIQPLTEARIVDLRSAPPKLRSQGTSNLQVVQLKLDKSHFFRKIATDVARANQQASDFASRDLCFN